MVRRFQNCRYRDLPDSQANYQLDPQIRRLEQDFLKEGGLRERMTQARLEARERARREPE